uniref:Uncharacterized protein n=1 Tax=Eutreptiella gymnastica TaxID=73025 RepID=A0A7S4FGA9_9EUGL
MSTEQMRQKITSERSWERRPRPQILPRKPNLPADQLPAILQRKDTASAAEDESREQQQEATFPMAASLGADDRASEEQQRTAVAETKSTGAVTDKSGGQVPQRVGLQQRIEEDGEQHREPDRRIVVAWHGTA